MNLPEKFDTYPEALKDDFLRFGKIKASGNGIQRKIGGKILIDVFNHFIILSQFIPIAEASLGADVTIGGFQ